MRTCVRVRDCVLERTACSSQVGAQTRVALAREYAFGTTQNRSGEANLQQHDVKAGALSAGRSVRARAHVYSHTWMFLVLFCCTWFISPAAPITTGKVATTCKQADA
eukprot:2502995-Pleurochrysis_carterae.AAC.1